MPATRLRLNLSADSTVGQIAAEIPASIAVFERHGVDYSHGGKHPLREVLRHAAIDYDQFAEEVSEASLHDTTCRCWVDEPLSDLITHIVVIHHNWLRQRLPSIEAMAGKLAEVAPVPDKNPAPSIRRIVAHLRADIEAHLRKEETTLFPAILAIEKAWDRGMPMPDHAGRVGHQMALLEREHESAGWVLEELRQLTANYTRPSQPGYQHLYDELKAFESRMRLHVHLENDILFPRSKQMQAEGARRT